MTGGRDTPGRARAQETSAKEGLACPRSLSTGCCLCNARISIRARGGGLNTELESVLECRRPQGGTDASDVWERQDLLHRDAREGDCAPGRFLSAGLRMEHPEARRRQHRV